MRKLWLAGVVVILVGCAEWEQRLAPTSARVDAGLSAELPPYTGPKARVAVADFQWKVGTVKETKVSAGAGGFTVSEQEKYIGGLADMLTTALVQSGRFRVVERKALSAIRAEQELGRTGEAEKGTAAVTGKIKGADLLIVAAVTGFEPGTSGISGGVGGAGSKLGAAISAAFRKSSIALDIRIIDSSTSEILAATRIEGVARDTNLAGIIGGITGNTTLGAGLSVFAKTPMEKAIRICINEAVKYIISHTPQTYFKY